MTNTVIDLHGMTTLEAKKYLITKLKNLPKNTSEVEVIHGYHGGSALLQMVRTFKYPTIERKILSLNQGSTIFVIKRDV